MKQKSLENKFPLTGKTLDDISNSKWMKLSDDDKCLVLKNTMDKFNKRRILN